VVTLAVSDYRIQELLLDLNHLHFVCSVRLFTVRIVGIGDRVIVYTVVILAAITYLMVTLVSNYLEVTHQVPAFKTLYLLKHNRLLYPLLAARLRRVVKLGSAIVAYFNIIVTNVCRFIFVLHAAIVLNVCLHEMTMLKFVLMAVFNITLLMFL